MASDLLLVGRRLLDGQFIRFLLVGGLNTVFGYGLFACLVLVRVPTALALLIATIVGAIFNYFTARHLVFTRRVESSRLGRFALVYGVVYVLNAGALFALERAALPTLWAQALLLPLFVPLTYLVNRSIVFGSPRKQWS